MEKLKKKIYVTQPSMPPLEEFIKHLAIIWDNKWLTNNGKFHQELEQKLCEYLGVKYVSLFCNGTLALMTALQMLKITGEVITTPFSFVATTHSLWWNKIKPIFVDIESKYMNIDADKIEAAITPKTTAILPVHVYGNPCYIEKIQSIAKKHNIAVIYDACHAFGVKINNNSILNYGNLSVLSFHATKIFTTFEGGAIICHDENTKRQIDFLKNFGFANETTVLAPGINAKMNEFQAALGILQLKYVDNYIIKRKEITNMYRSELSNINGIHFNNDIEGVKHNFQYFPILIKNDSAQRRNFIYEELKKHNIYSRRYFYPLISHFSPYKDLPSSSSENLPVAEEISKEVLCLPLYPDLENNDVKIICSIIKKCFF